MSINSVPLELASSRATSVRSVLVTSEELDAGKTPRLGIANVVSGQEKVAKDSWDLFFSYGLVLAPAKPSNWLFQVWERFYLVAMWATLGFQCMLVFTELHFRSHWSAVPVDAQMVCKTFEVFGDGILKVLIGLVNPLCYFAARDAFKALLVLRIPPDAVKAEWEREWRWTIRFFGSHVLLFTLGSMFYYTIVFGEGWRPSNPRGGPLSNALVRHGYGWVQMLVYILFAPLQNLINQAIPWSFVAVHALLVRLVALCLNGVERSLESVSEPTAAEVLDGYHEALERLHTVMRKLRRNYAFDLYILFVLLQAVFVSLRLYLGLLRVQVSGVLLFTNGQPPLINGTNVSEPSCHEASHEETELDMANAMADYMTMAQKSYLLVVILLLLAWGNHLGGELLKKLPRGVHRCAEAKTTEQKRQLLKWLRECILTAPVEFKVAQIKVNYETASVLLLAQLLPLISQGFKNVLG